MILFADMDDVDDFDEETGSESSFRGVWGEMVTPGLLLLVEDEGLSPQPDLAA